MVGACHQPFLIAAVESPSERNGAARWRLRHISDKLINPYCLVSLTIYFIEQTDAHAPALPRARVLMSYRASEMTYIWRAGGTNSDFLRCRWERGRRVFLRALIILASAATAAGVQPACMVLLLRLLAPGLAEVKPCSFSFAFQLR